MAYRPPDTPAFSTPWRALPWSPSITDPKTPGHSQLLTTPQRGRARLLGSPRSDHDSSYNGLASAQRADYLNSAGGCRQQQLSTASTLPIRQGEEAGASHAAGWRVAWPIGASDSDARLH